MGVCNVLTYMHTRMISFLLITLCKFVNKTYIISHDMRKNMVSERGGGADKKKKKKKKKKTSTEHNNKTTAHNKKATAHIV